MRNKLKYFTGILFGSLLILLGSAATFSEFKTGNYKQKLSEYGFFMGDMANLQPGADLIPYKLYPQMALYPFTGRSTGKLPSRSCI